MCWFSLKWRKGALRERVFRPSGGDFQGIRGLPIRYGSFESAETRPLRSVHRLDEPAELSLGMVASQQSQLPFRPAASL